MTEKERIVEIALDGLVNEILYESVDEDYLLEEFMNEDFSADNYITEGFNVPSMNKKIDRLVKIGMNKKVIGVEKFGKDLKVLLTQAVQAQKNFEASKKSGDKERIKQSKKELKNIKMKALLAYKTFKKGIASHRKTALKLFFALSSVLGLFLFIGVRISRRNRYALMMNNIKDDIANNKEMLDKRLEDKITKEFEEVVKEEE